MKPHPPAIFGTRAMRYAYPNSRVKAMQATLLPRASMEQMIDAAKIADVIGVLERTEYKQDLTEPALKYSGAELVEFALGRNLVRKARRILSFTPADALPAVLGVLEKWDVYNLKTILLGKHLGYPNEEIAPFMVPAGAFTSQELTRLQEKGSIEDMVSLLGGTEYGKGLKPLLPAYQKSKNIQPLLNMIEKRFYATLSRSIPAGTPDGACMLRLVRADIDNRNLMNILRGKREDAKDAEITGYMIRGGALSAHDLEKFIQCRTMDEAVKMVCDKNRLGAALEAYRQSRSLAAIEIELDRKVIELGLRTLRVSVLSPGAIVGYLYLKENEITNIRKVVRGKEFLMPPEKLRETLVLVS